MNTRTHADPLTIAQANRLAKHLGLVRGRGTYNGRPYYTFPGSGRIITLERLLEMADEARQEKAP